MDDGNRYISIPFDDLMNTFPAQIANAVVPRAFHELYFTSKQMEISVSITDTFGLR